MNIHSQQKTKLGFPILTFVSPRTLWSQGRCDRVRQGRRSRETGTKTKSRERQGRRRSRERDRDEDKVARQGVRDEVGDSGGNWEFWEEKRLVPDPKSIFVHF